MYTVIIFYIQIYKLYMYATYCIDEMKDSININIFSFQENDVK